jgi:simple sugar transport system permease protein
MSDVAAVVTAEPPTVTRHTIEPHVDERVSFRGPLRRLLVSPEIGALIGAIVVWAFFWGNADTFGRASSTLNWLDVAAPLGIMAVAVALLMIGGEFDLSSGVMSGASAIQIGLMGRYFMGDGGDMWFVVLAAFAAAGTIGWFNGTLVNRTGLPSFIVTLATFFVLRGVNLVMAKRFEGKVQVDEIEKVKGYKTFYDWVAHEWKLSNFAVRDKLFVAMVLAGVLAAGTGLMLQSFRRRSGVHMPSLGLSAAGLVLTLGSFQRLLRTDGVAANTLWALVGAVGVLLIAVGLGRGLFQPAAAPDHPMTSGVVRRLSLGALMVAAACVVPQLFDRNNGQPILTWVGSNLRPVIGVLAALTGLAAAVYTRRASWRGARTFGSVVPLVFVTLFTGLLTFVGTLIVLQLATVQALRAVGLMLLGTGGVVLLLLARGRVAGRTARLSIGLATTASIVVIAFVVRADSSAERFRSGLFTALLLGALAIAVNTVLEVTLEKRTVGTVGPDRVARWLVNGGVASAAVGLAIRVCFSNYTVEEAAARRAAGASVAVSVLRQSVLWWVLVTVVAAFVLSRMRRGNWVFAVGGNKDAARAIGVPANQVKVMLFVTVSMLACFAGLLIALRYTTVQANQGYGEELEYIIAAVVGGCLLTGGYGSVIGAALGATIMAMSNNGISTTDWNPDARYTFLGLVLLAAVLVNTYIRKKAQEAR